MKAAHLHATKVSENSVIFRAPFRLARQVCLERIPQRDQFQRLTRRNVLDENPHDDSADDDIESSEFCYIDLRMKRLSKLSESCLVDGLRAARDCRSYEYLVLNLSLNRLASLPSGLLRNPKLDGPLFALDLSRNLLQDVPSLLLQGHGRLSFLTALNLSNNRLERIVPGLQELVSLTSLDLSMNEIASISNLAHLPKLERLSLAGNALTVVEGLDTLTSLTHLDLQRNRIEDLTGVALLRGLVSLNASGNALRDLPAVHRAIVTLPALRSLQLHGNPVASDANYRVVLLENQNLAMLDNKEIKAFFRKHMGDLRQKKKIDTVIEAVTNEYLGRIHFEHGKLTRAVAQLRELIRQHESVFSKYKNAMEAELEDVVRYLQRVQAREIADRELIELEQDEDVEEEEEDEMDEFALLQSEEDIELWLTELAKFETERRAAEEREAHEEEQMRQRNTQERLRTATAHQKLFEISLKRPDVWRKIKERQMERLRGDEQMNNRLGMLQRSSSTEAAAARVERQQSDQVNPDEREGREEEQHAGISAVLFGLADPRAAMDAESDAHSLVPDDLLSDAHSVSSWDGTDGESSIASSSDDGTVSVATSKQSSVASSHLLAPQSSDNLLIEEALEVVAAKPPGTLTPTRSHSKRHERTKQLQPKKSRSRHSSRSPRRKPSSRRRRPRRHSPRAEASEHPQLRRHASRRNAHSPRRRKPHRRRHRS